MIRNRRQRWFRPAAACPVWVRVTALALFPVLGGCAVLWQTAFQEPAYGVPQAPLVRVARYPSPPMKIKRAAHVAVGIAVGGPVGIVFGHRAHQVEGEATLAEFGIRPPIERVQANFADGLRRGLGLSRLVVEPDAIGDMGDLPPAVPGELVFRLHTEKDKFAFFLTDMNHYRLKYRVEARLIRRRDGRVLWRRECAYNSNRAARPPAQPEGNPTLAALKDEGARELRGVLWAAADACTEELLTEFLGQVPMKRIEAGGPLGPIAAGTR